jgi:hypothetical protein
MSPTSTAEILTPDHETALRLRRALSIREPMRLYGREVSRWCANDARRMGEPWPGLRVARSLLRDLERAEALYTAP